MVGGHPRNQLTVVAPADCATPIHIECPSDCLDNCLEQYSTVRYGTVQHSVVHRSAVRCRTAGKYVTAKFDTTQSSAVRIYNGTVRIYTGTVRYSQAHNTAITTKVQ